MPNTTAVRKAKDTMAASTLSLVCNSILASFCRTICRRADPVSPRLGANLGGRRAIGQQKSLLRRNNFAANLAVSRLPQRMMHTNHDAPGLIQEAISGTTRAFIYY
jgi:hypothetical protein